MVLNYVGGSHKQQAQLMGCTIDCASTIECIRLLQPQTLLLDHYAGVGRLLWFIYGHLCGVARKSA